MNFHSEALWREIKVHVDMGMTPTRAIAAATRINAQIIGKGRELGSIEPGKIANGIVTNGDPLEVRTEVRYLFIDGQLTSTDNRHRDLYEQYRKRPAPGHSPYLNSGSVCRDESLFRRGPSTLNVREL